jgi:hypothetical protein
MRELLKKALSQSEDVSMMRLMCLASLLCAMFIALVGLFSNKDLSQVAILVGSFLVPAFGGKVLQKSRE